MLFGTSIGSAPISWQTVADCTVPVAGLPANLTGRTDYIDLANWTRNGGYFMDGTVENGRADDAFGVPGPFSHMAGSSAFQDITDGTANTIAMGEIRPRCWSEQEAYGFAYSNNAIYSTTPPINFPTCPNEDPKYGSVCYRNWDWTARGFKSRHSGGAQFVLCDGSTRFISQTIDYGTYQRLGDKHDGYPISNF